MRADRASLDECVGGPAHHFAVLEGSRLRLVGIAAQVMRLPVTGLHEGPFHARREACSSPAAQSRFLDNVNYFGGRHGQRLLQCLIAASLLPAIEGPGFLLAKMAREERGLAWMRLVRIAHQASRRRMSGTFSGVTDSMNSSLIMIGVAKPQAPRHSTSMTVNLPSDDETPSSPAPVWRRSAFTTSSAPQMPQGDVVHT